MASSWRTSHGTHSSFSHPACEVYPSFYVSVARPSSGRQLAFSPRKLKQEKWAISHFSLSCPTT